jgi:hypothetical protein
VFLAVLLRFTRDCPIRFEARDRKEMRNNPGAWLEFVQLGHQLFQLLGNKVHGDDVGIAEIGRQEVLSFKGRECFDAGRFGLRTRRFEQLFVDFVADGSAAVLLGCRDYNPPVAAAQVVNHVRFLHFRQLEHFFDDVLGRGDENRARSATAVLDVCHHDLESVCLRRASRGRVEQAADRGLRQPKRTNPIKKIL